MMGPPAARGKKRKAPTSSSSSAGGMGLLDGIMGSMARTMDRLPVRRAGVGGAEAQEEVDSHYMMARQTGKEEKPGDKLVCRNTECAGRDFDIDMRQGDKICRSCGAVQNMRNLESYEEEKRTFADDDKKEDKSRTSKVTGKGGGAVGPQNMARVAKETEKFADADGGMSIRDQKKIDLYASKVLSLANNLRLSGEIISEGRKLCERLVIQQISHDRECGKPEQCRLRFRHRSAAVVGAAVLKEAMTQHNVDRLYEELKTALRDEPDVTADTARGLNKCSLLVKDLLKGRPFFCEAETEQESAEAMGVGGVGGAGGGASSSSSSAAAAAGGGADGGGGVLHPHRAVGVIPRLVDGLGLQYFLQVRATEVIEDWQRGVMPAIMPQTTASLALLRAYDELITPNVRSGAIAPSSVPPLTLALLSEESGMTQATILKHCNSPDLPWPTTILAEATKALVSEGVLPPTVADAARRTLEGWLAKHDGPVRAFCRQARPRDLAACALQKAVQADAAVLGGGGGGGGGTGGSSSSAAADVAAAGPALGQPVSAAQIAAALSTPAGDLVTPASLEAALATMPPGA